MHVLRYSSGITDILLFYFIPLSQQGVPNFISLFQQLLPYGKQSHDIQLVTREGIYYD